MKKVSVLGSFVTRDAMGFLDKEKLGLVNYIARTSIISVVAESLNIPISDIMLESNFQKQMVNHDLNKDTIDVLLNDESEFLVIDLIDERFEVFKTSNSYLTYSNEFIRTDLLNKKIEGKKISFDAKSLLWKESINLLINRVCEKYHSGRIIINKVLYSNKFINKSGEVEEFSNCNEINEKNSMLLEMYDYISLNFPDVSFIEYKEDFYADESNKWGLSPFHFEEDFYKYFSERLMQLTSEHKIFRNEKIFRSSKNIRYIFEEGILNTDKLLIVFSAFNGNKTSQYNYIRALEKYDTNKLFILDDYGVGGSYYLGNNNEVEGSVIALINFFIAKLNLRFSDVVAIGSSKGGSSALYFGLKYSLGAVIAGGFQIKIGDYLSKTTPQTMEYMVGEINDASILKLNTIHEKLVRKDGVLTKLYFHGGTGDYHYIKSMKPFMDILDYYMINYDLDLKQYNSHNEVGDYFVNYLDKILSGVLSSTYNVVLSHLAESNEIMCTCLYRNDLKYAFYIYKDDILIDKIWYSSDNTLIYKIRENGIYRVAYFMKKGESLKVGKTNEIEIIA